MEPVWLSADDAVALNQWVVEETGERHLVRDRGLLESALHRPQAAYLYDELRDIVQLAALLLFAIAQNHPSNRATNEPASTPPWLFSA